MLCWDPAGLQREAGARRVNEGEGTFGGVFSSPLLPAGPAAGPRQVTRDTEATHPRSHERAEEPNSSRTGHRVPGASPAPAWLWRVLRQRPRGDAC